MIEQYRLDVLKYYEEKKANGKLSGNLMHPTCASLRNECLNNFRYRCDKLEERMLKEFFGQKLNEELNERLLRKCDADKFKPLVNFLKKDVKTHEKNIEILAWLIDFRPRPYSNYWRLSSAQLPQLPQLSLLEESTTQNNEVELILRNIVKSISPEMYSNVFNYEIQDKRNSLAKWFVTNIEKIKYPDLSPKVTNEQREIKLEYPSGVKLYVDASDLSLIEQLVRL